MTVRKCFKALCAWGFLAFAALALLLPTPSSAQDRERALAAFEAGRYQEAASIWTALAEAGDPQAQYSLGKLHENGQGVPQSYARAAEWYELSAAQGLAAAQNNLALLHSTGRGVPRDANRSAALWQQAAAQGHVQAQYNLALAYYLGEGVALSDRQAALWFARAAEAGLPEAQFALGQMYRMGVGLPADSALALAWYDRAAAQGHAEAMRKSLELSAANVTAAEQTDASLLAAANNEAAQAPPTAIEEVELEAEAEGTLTETLAEEVILADQVADADLQDTEIEQLVADVVAVADADEEQGSAIGAVPPPMKPERPIQLVALKAEPATAASASVTATTPVPAAAQFTGVLAASDGAAIVWLGTGNDEAEARSLVSLAMARFPEIFEELVPLVVTASQNGKTLYRVEVGPLTDLAGARSLCSSLRGLEPNFFCKVLPRS